MEQSTQMEPGRGVAARKASTAEVTAASSSTMEKTMVHFLASTAQPERMRRHMQLPCAPS